LDPKFALAWALLSYVDARGYFATFFPRTVSIREEARQAAETALTLQPNLGEAVLAKGYYHYACLKDYDTAVRYFNQARRLLPNSSRGTSARPASTKLRGFTRGTFICSPSRLLPISFVAVSRKRCESLMRFSILSRMTLIPSR